MKINGTHFRTIWENPDNPGAVEIIDQRLLPHRFEIVELNTTEDFVLAIKDMYVRGAPLIGATAAYAVYNAAYRASGSDDFEFRVKKAAEKINSARPTAINLTWAVNEVLGALGKESGAATKIEAALAKARQIVDEDAENCRKIGEYGAEILEKISKSKNGKPVNILTHCNAGWLATVDWGTATAPIYVARERGIEMHVWVDETRPRNQGAKLTAFELGHENIPHSIIVDNTGGHLMQHGLVDLVIVGSDRTTRRGDVANKIGTYLKALAARDNGVPFFVALPSSTIDWNIRDGLKDIPIELRDPDEVLYVDGLVDNDIRNVLVPPKRSAAVNYAFDVTPARLVTGLITERGVCDADEKSILELFPEMDNSL